MSKKAVFLDRDGVLNHRLPDGAYVTTWAEFRFCRGVKKALRLLKQEGYLLIVVTNQRGVGRGLMTEEDLSRIHRRMERELEKSGAPLDAILYCPHDIDAACRCRKPQPGMILEALRRFGIERSGSYIIGDSETDLEAGRAAGLRGLLIVSGRRGGPRGVHTAPSLQAAAEEIVRRAPGEVLT